MGMRVLVESKLYLTVGHENPNKFSTKDPKPGELTMTRWKINNLNKLCSTCCITSEPYAVGLGPTAEGQLRNPF